VNDKRTVTIFYTDIKGSTPLANTLGGVEMGRLKGSHFQLIRTLVETYNGSYIKSLGDGVLGYFNNPADALFFATSLQQIEQYHPGLERFNFEVKIGMAHSEVIVDSDIDGVGANLAARVLGKSQPGEVIFESGAYDALCHHWSPDKCSSLVKDLGEHELKGFPAPRHLFLFDWRKLNADDHLVADLVSKQLKFAGFELTNTTSVRLDATGRIFWPVSPRDLATAIHRGQLEAIKILSYCGWKTHLFVTDSEQLFADGQADTRFENKIKEFAKSIGVKIEQVDYMSKMFATDAQDLPALLASFNRSASANTVRAIFNMEGKEYPDRDNLIKNRTLLKFLRPVFTIVAFQKFLSEYSPEPIMVIAGDDENTRWNNVLASERLYDRINMVFNPELRKGESTELQKERWPLWLSKEQFIGDMNGTNLLDWAFRLFVVLPNFPFFQTICGRYCGLDCGAAPESCERTNLVRDKLADEVRGKCWD